MAGREAPTTAKTRLAAARYAVLLGLARLALIWERLWPAVWPAAGIAGLFIGLALLDVFPQLPAWLHVVALGAFLAAFGYFAWWAFGDFRAPGRRDARRRLETASGLEHRPLSVLEDTLATGGEDDQSAALWQLHRERMTEMARRLRVGVPAPGLARRDPFSLRGALLLVLVIAGAASWQAPAERLLRAVMPQFGETGKALAGAFDLWIAPPDYTGVAPVFPLKLKAADAPAAEPSSPPSAQAVKAVPVLEVPEKSRVISQVQGRGSVPSLTLGDTATDFTRVDPVHSRIEATIEKTGPLAVTRDKEVLGAWLIKVIPDRAPAISYAEKPAPTPRSALRLSFVARDDYGLAGATAVIRRSYEKGEVIGKETTRIELALPGRNVRQARETGFHDLTPHKWAGLPVVMELIATDGIGQTGRSERISFLLPERNFVHKVARAIIEQRKRLTETPEKRASVMSELERIAAAPSAYGDDSVVFLSLISARSRLLHNKKIDSVLESIRDLLWDTALRLEDGNLSIAERELRRAQKALMKALAENASDKELERLMHQLQAALNRYLQAMARQMQKLPQPQQVMELNPNMMLLQASDFQRMMERLRNMIRSGAKQAAREMLARLQRMLENLRSAQMFRIRMPGTPGAGMIRRLQEMMRQQQQLMDRTFRQSRPGMGQPGFGRLGAAQQRALREALRRLRGQMRGPGSGPGRFLDQAGQAMERAMRALEQNQPGNATGPQGEALDRLQRAGRGLMQQMMDRFTRRSGGKRAPRATRTRPRRDPLGREIGDDYDSSDVKIPDQADIQRAQKILDELRRRSGQINRPAIELEYIDRLLRRF